jgi:hypothetical protein
MRSLQNAKDVWPIIDSVSSFELQLSMVAVFFSFSSSRVQHSIQRHTGHNSAIESRWALIFMILEAKWWDVTYLSNAASRNFSSEITIWRPTPFSCSYIQNGVYSKEQTTADVDVSSSSDGPKCLSARDPSCFEGNAFGAQEIFRINFYSTVGIATGYGLDGQGIGFRVPVEARIFISPCRPDRFWGPPSLLSNGYRAIFPGE